MHMYQGKGRWGSTCRSFDLASPDLRVTDLRYEVHTSPLHVSNQLHHYGASLDFLKSQEREGGPPPGDQEGPWRGPTLGRARRPPGFLVDPLDAPLRLYLPLGVETPKTDPFFANTSLFRRRRQFKIGAAWRSCSGTLPKGATPSGRPSIATDASHLCRE